jgi:hypothetical protein
MCTLIHEYLVQREPYANITLKRANVYYTQYTDDKWNLTICLVAVYCAHLVDYTNVFYDYPYSPHLHDSCNPIDHTGNGIPSKEDTNISIDRSSISNGEIKATFTITGNALTPHRS